MALFKILKGPEKKDSTGKSVMLNPVASGLAIKEGWAYVTDAGNFYVDISDTTRVKINQNADFSVKAENDSSNQKITDTYIKDIIYNKSGTAPYYTLKLGDSTLKTTNGVTDKVIIPVASATQAGIITADKTNAQTITGAKIIDKNGSLEIQKAEGFKYSGIQTASATGARSVWFSLLNSSGTPCINNSFKFDPDETLNITKWSNEASGTKSSVLHVPHIDGLAYKALRDSQDLVIDDTYIKDVVLTNNATAPYYTLTLGNGLSKANADGTNQKVLLPVAGQNYAGVITNAAQSISGKKTFLNGIAIKLTTTNTNATYYPWFSTVDSGGIGTPIYNTNFNYNANTNKLTATTFVGSLEGNAATATALTTSAGSTTQPIYFSGGKPVAITGSIANNTTGNAATATLLQIHNSVTNTSTRSISPSGWTGGVSGLSYMWGQSFKDTSIGSDTGDLVLAVRPGQYTSGKTELCMMIDGDYYSMGHKVIHAGNYNTYAPTKTGGGASGTWGISITGNAATATNADKLDGYHASDLKGMFANTDGFGKTYTFTKTITIGTNWSSTGIASGNLPSGVYVIYMTGIYDTDKSWQSGNIYAGIMSWYSGNTNSSERSEIILHTTGHAHNGYLIFLSTLSHGGNIAESTTLEIKSNIAFTRETAITFKFVKII